MGCINKKQEIKSELQINDLIPKNKLLENKITTIIDTNEKNSLIIKKTEISLNNINPIIINEPKIICILKNIENNYEKKLIITPNSINGHIIKEEEGKHETARKKEKVKTPKAPKKQARRAKH